MTNTVSQIMPPNKSLEQAFSAKMEPTTGIEPVKPLPYQGSALPTELRGLGFDFRAGAGDEARTRDIQLGRLKLYQLSYSRIWLHTTRRANTFVSVPMRT